MAMLKRDIVQLYSITWMPVNLGIDICQLYVDKLLVLTNSVELAHIFKLTATDFLSSVLFSLFLHCSLQAWTLTWMYPWTWVLVAVVVAELLATKSRPSPNWRNFGLLTLWSRTANLVKTRPLLFLGQTLIELGWGFNCIFERWLNSVKHTLRYFVLLFWLALCDCVLMFVCVGPSGAMSSGLRLEDSPFYDFLSPGPSPLSPPGQSMGSVGDGWPPRANSPPPHGNTVTWPPGMLALKCTNKQNIFFVCVKKTLIAACVCLCFNVQSSDPGSLGKVTPTLTLRLTRMWPPAVSSTTSPSTPSATQTTSGTGTTVGHTHTFFL